jgi:hypothetical protein
MALCNGAPVAGVVRRVAQPATRTTFGEDRMYRKYLLTAAVLVAFTGAGYAATATSFWVAQDAKTKKCEVVTKKPDGKTLIEVGKVHYKTQAAADTAMKSAKECAPPPAKPKTKTPAKTPAKPKAKTP